MKKLKLEELLEGIEDTRRGNSVMYPLHEVLFIMIVAIMCGATSYIKIEMFGKSRQDWFTKYLKLENGIPDALTYRRILMQISSDKMHEIFVKWMKSVICNLNGVVALDGKQARRTGDKTKKPLYVVSAFAHELYVFTSCNYLFTENVLYWRIIMIYLVRHGQTDWNIEKKTQGHTDISLNANGRNQAELLSDGIAALQIDRVVFSDLSRARETAEIINKKIGCSIELDSRLREINYGVLEGVCRDNLTQKDWDVFNTTPEVLNAEPMISVFSRIKSCFDELSKVKENVLVVTHGGALRMIMFYASSREEFVREKYVEFCQSAKINNAAVFKWKPTMDSIQPIDF